MGVVADWAWEILGCGAGGLEVLIWLLGGWLDVGMVVGPDSVSDVLDLGVARGRLVA